MECAVNLVKSSNRNTSLHCLNSRQNNLKQSVSVSNKEQRFWDETLEDLERLMLLRKAGIGEEKYGMNWQYFTKDAQQQIKKAIKKVALWAVIAGIQ